MARLASVLFPLLLTLVVVSAVPSPAAVSAFQEGATPPASPTASPVTINGIDLLTEEQVPDGLIIIDDRERSLDEITANFSDPAAAREQFVAWGWERNFIRAFHVPKGTSADPALIDGIYISVHVFASPEAAAEALTYSLDVQASGSDLAEIDIEPMGDSSRALYGSVAYGNEITFYVQRNDILIRLSASSPEGDPRAETTELMRTMLGNSPAS